MVKKKVEGLTIEEKLNNALIPVDKQPYKIPQNWCWVNWSSAGNLIAGNGFPNKYQGFKDYEIPFYKVGSLKLSDRQGYIFDDTNTINNDILKILKCSLIPTNSILFAKIGEAIKLNRRSINNKPCCIDNNMMAFIPKCCLFKYAYYWTTTIDLYKYAKATVVPALRKIELDIIPFPLPPLEEQERIVNKLDNYISKLDEAKEKLEKVVDTYNYRKNLILHRAFTGQLTKNWRKENKFELNDDIKKKAITKDSMLPDEYLYKIPENWRWVRLESLLSEIKSGTTAKQDKSKIGYNVTRIESLQNQTIDFNRLGSIINSGQLKENDFYIPNDIVLSNINSEIHVGKTALITKEMLPLVHGMNLLRLRFKSVVISKLFQYYTQSNIYKNEVHSRIQRFVNQVSINSKHINSLPFPLPPLEEQKEIVKILDSVLSKEKQVKEIAEKEIERVEDLKKNILTRAFGGVLGTNDPNEENSIELLKTVL